MKRVSFLVVSSILLGALPSWGASLTGKVTFKGNPPAMKPVRMNADPTCVEENPNGANDESIVMDQEGALQNVFVYVKEGLAQTVSSPSRSAVVLDQKGCRFTPHVIGVQTGQTIEIVNSDPVLHNVHAVPRTNQGFNAGMPQKNMKITRHFDKPEIGVKVKCDVHPWMKAYVNIVEHPFFAVTGTGGEFEITDLPPGRYQVAAWHEQFGMKEISVIVPGNKSVSVNFEFTQEPKKKDSRVKSRRGNRD
jgi:plastocyanin